ncbi:hypothetical protein BJ546DRAFT_530827 [Cryomyces antarcticus]
MSASTPPALQAPDDRRRNFGRYVERFEMVLRRASSSKNDVPKVTIPPNLSATVAANDTRPISPTPEAQWATESDMEAAVTTPVGPSIRTAAQQERTRALFAKYGLAFEPLDCTPLGLTHNAKRIERPIRMRIHRSCHRCQITFGFEKICSKCEHRRCMKCPRYPPRK